MKGPVVLHPFLLVVYIVLGLLAQNVGEADPLQATRAGCLLLILAALVLALGKRFSGDVRAAGLLVTALLVVIFGHGLAGGWIGAMGIDADSAAAFAILLGLEGATLLFAGYWILRWRDPHGLVTRLLNVVTAALAVMALAEIALHEVRNERGLPAPTAGPAIELHPESDPPPDIYYVVLDAYARSDVLLAIYNADNRRLLQFLDERGFWVAERARTN